MLSELIIAGQVWANKRALGPIGEILLRVADASVVPTPGSLDFLVILLVGAGRNVTLSTPSAGASLPR